MFLQGGSIQGARYGGVSPLDFNGLKFWFRASDGVDLLRGNIIKRWKDISGNGNHLVPASGKSYGLRYYNSAFGRYVSGIAGGSTEPLNCINNGVQKLLTDGSPYSVILIINTGPVNSSGGLTGQPANMFPIYAIAISSNAGTRSVTRLIQNTITEIGVNANGSLNYFSDNQNLLVADVGYGYLTSGRDLTTWINSVPAASTDWINPPSLLAPPNKFAITGDTGVKFYEIIIYNHTGKDRPQINDELNKLTTEYINKRYPNFY